ncbi:MAG TPA: hypothetical protein VGG06_23890 [Thermoanaerobaculia bacterium]
MSDVDGRTEALQFDRAEYEGSGETAGAAPIVRCTGCGQSIPDSYYKVNDQVVCGLCHAKALAARGPGGGAGRFFRALGLALAAGIAGAALYYAVLALTGYEVGLIAIVVGFIVGIAVRSGSRHRGGWLYQGLAMAVTYLAIVSTYVPMVIQGIRAADLPATQESGAPNQTPTDETVVTASAPAAPTQDVEQEVILFVIACALALVVPFLSGFDNILGLIIIGIGLYEAWKLNKRQAFAAEGPFQVGVQPA